MKISTKGRYALRLMLDLALADSSEPIPLRDVAKRQERTLPNGRLFQSNI